LADCKEIASMTYRYHHKRTFSCVEVKFKTFTFVLYPRNTKDLDIKLSSCNSTRVWFLLNFTLKVLTFLLVISVSEWRT